MNRRLLLTLGAAALCAAPCLAQSSGEQAGNAFDKLVANAEQAKKENRLEDAAGLYRDAVRLRPGWADGHWALATLLYDLDHYEEASVHFGAVVTYQPQNSAALALEGLCEAKLQHYQSALTRLQKAFGMGIPDPNIVKMTALQIALLVNRLGNPDVALQLLGSFASANDDSPPVIMAFGLALLRRPLMLEEVPPEQRPMLMLAGRAAFQMGRGRRTEVGRLAMDELVTRYPLEPGVHWAYGAYIQEDDPDRALSEFRRELEISPNHFPSMLQMASIDLQRGDIEPAFELAQRALKTAPESPAVHLLMGRVLLEKGDAAGAIAALERGVEMAPDSPDFYFALARAYQQAGRRADAERAKKTFERLKQARAAPPPIGSQAPSGAGGGAAPPANDGQFTQ